MKMIGIRASTQGIRYAILAKNEEGEISFINQSGEHCLRLPSTIEEIGGKLLWMKREFERIIRQNPDISAAIIKTNEFAGENNAKRETSYMDAVLLLTFTELRIPVYKRLYSQIGTTSNKTKEHAEHRVGKTDKYWNNTIADAINCVFWEIRRA